MARVRRASDDEPGFLAFVCCLWTLGIGYYIAMVTLSFDSYARGTAGDKLTTWVLVNGIVYALPLFLANECWLVLYQLATIAWVVVTPTT